MYVVVYPVKQLVLNSKIKCSSPSNLVVWSLVLLALMEPIATILIVLARH